MLEKKSFVLPLMIGYHSPIVTPGGRPAEEEQVAGVLRWSVDEWDEEEFAKVASAVEFFIRNNTGKSLGSLIEIIARGVSQILPGRNLTITIGILGLEYKYEDKPEGAAPSP